MEWCGWNTEFCAALERSFRGTPRLFDTVLCSGGVTRNGRGLASRSGPFGARLRVSFRRFSP